MSTNILTIDDEQVKLTRKSASAMVMLNAAAPNCVTYEYMCKFLFGEDLTERTATYVRHVVGDLRRYVAHTRVEVINVYGMGYRILRRGNSNHA